MKVINMVGWIVVLFLAVMGFIVEVKADAIEINFWMGAVFAFAISFLLPIAILLGEFFIVKIKNFVNRTSQEGNFSYKKDIASIGRVLLFSSAGFISFSVINSIASWFKNNYIIGPGIIIFSFGLGLFCSLFLFRKSYGLMKTKDDV